MLVQRTVGIDCAGINWSAGGEVFLDPGETMLNYRFIRGYVFVNGTGIASCSPVIVLRDSAGAVIGIWQSVHPAGGAELGIGVAAHVHCEGSGGYQSIGNPIVNAVTFGYVRLPENLIVLQGQRLFFALAGASGAVSAVFMLTYAYDDGR